MEKGSTPRSPGMRFTVRRMMIAVAVVAAVLFLGRSALWFFDAIKDAIDEPFVAVRELKKSWDLGPTGSIFVDVFEGSISVLPSPDGKVNAEITVSVLADDSRSAADEALEMIDVQTDQQGDTLRISARGASGPHPGSSWVRKDVMVALYVPPGVRLDLRTGRGDVLVGRSYDGTTPLHRPIATPSIRARNDSPYRMGYSEGNIIVETTPMPAFEGSATTRLQLDATGQIEILAANAQVEARAWHGIVPPGWTPARYEKKECGGSIQFEGTLAEGAHSFRAAHRIEMKLPPEKALRVDSEAVGGTVSGDLLPEKVETHDGRSMWNGSIGLEPRVNLRLRTDEGPITLRKQQ